MNYGPFLPFFLNFIKLNKHLWGREQLSFVVLSTEWKTLQATLEALRTVRPRALSGNTGIRVKSTTMTVVILTGDPLAR